MSNTVLTTIWRALPVAIVLSRAAALTVAYTAHELGHALVAALLGDDTPRHDGRLTLNPLRHVDGLGVLLGLFLGVGWCRRTRFDPYQSRLPALLAALLISLAGPLTNLALMGGALGLMAWLGLGPQTPTSGWPTAAGVLTVFARFNLGVALINLLPLFPFDAFNLVRYVLPVRAITGWEYFSGWTTSLVGVSLALMAFMPSGLYWRLTTSLTTWADQLFMGW
jgi:Zn-dependent protease